MAEVEFAVRGQADLGILHADQAWLIQGGDGYQVVEPVLFPLEPPGLAAIAASAAQNVRIAPPDRPQKASKNGQVCDCSRTFLRKWRAANCCPHRLR